jgi:hypothetical protein
MEKPMIDTVPLPEAVRVRIPADLLREFDEELRIIVGPWPQGLILLPSRFIDSRLADVIGEEYEVALIPKSQVGPRG